MRPRKSPTAVNGVAAGVGVDAVEKGARWYWCVADGANPDRRYSLLDVNQFPPEFGPFETRQQAEEFADMRDAYYVTSPTEARAKEGL